MDVAAVLGIFLFVFAGFVCFCIYFIFKQLEFVIRAINLYERIVDRQDMTVKLLQEIRDTSSLAPDSLSKQYTKSSTFKQNLNQTGNLKPVTETDIAEDETGKKDKKTWKCMCGAENEEALNNCSKCSKFKQEESRWS